MCGAVSFLCNRQERSTVCLGQPLNERQSRKRIPMFLWIRLPLRGRSRVHLFLRVCLVRKSCVLPDLRRIGGTAASSLEEPRGFPLVIPSEGIASGNLDRVCIV